MPQWLQALLTALASMKVWAERIWPSLRAFVAGYLAREFVDSKAREKEAVKQLERERELGERRRNLDSVSGDDLYERLQRSYEAAKRQGRVS